MNDDGNSIHKYYAQFLSSKKYEDKFSGSEYDLAKRSFCRHENILLDLLFNKSKSFEWQL